MTIISGVGVKGWGLLNKYSYEVLHALNTPVYMPIYKVKGGFEPLTPPGHVTIIIIVFD